LFPDILINMNNYKYTIINLIQIYNHDDSLFVKQCKAFGMLRRHVHSLEELCRKHILVYSEGLPEKIEDFNFESGVETLKLILGEES
jgi:hypothetical protein